MFSLFSYMYKKDLIMTKDIKDYPIASLNELKELCLAESKAKGWNSKDEAPEEIDLSSYVANLHGECSELYEAFRNNKLFAECDKADKMREHGIEVLNCAEEEVADLIVRSLILASVLNINVEKAVTNKLLYNRTRPFRNGNKKT